MKQNYPYANLLKKKKKKTHLFKKIGKCQIFHAKLREKQKKVIIITYVQFSTQNQVKSKKKVIMSAEVQFSTQNQVKRAKKGNFSTQKQVKKKKDHHAHKKMKKKRVDCLQRIHSS